MLRQLVEHYFWVCLPGCLGKRLALASLDWVKMLSPIQVGSSKPFRAWREQKSRGRTNSLWARADTFFFACPGTAYILPGTCGSWACSPRLGLIPLAPRFSVVQTQTELYHHIPGSPACRQLICLILGILGLHNHLN